MENKNINDISQIILSMSLNIDDYNKRKIYEFKENLKKSKKKQDGTVDSSENPEHELPKEFLYKLLEEPVSLDFFDYFSKTKNIWKTTITYILEELEIGNEQTLEDEDIQYIAAAVVRDSVNYMYIQNIQYEFKKDNKNVETLTARRYIEDLLKEPRNTVEVEIGKKNVTYNETRQEKSESLFATLITRRQFINIIRNIIRDKEYTDIDSPTKTKGYISNLFSSKIGGNKSRKPRKYRKTRKSKKYKKSIKITKSRKRIKY